MAARKPAASTLLKQAQAQIEKLEKDLATKTTLYNSASEERNKLQTEVDQLHAMLDAIPGAPSKDVPGVDSWMSGSKRTVLSRLAGYFATRS